MCCGQVSQLTSMDAGEADASAPRPFVPKPCMRLLVSPRCAQVDDAACRDKTTTGWRPLGRARASRGRRSRRSSAFLPSWGWLTASALVNRPARQTNAFAEPTHSCLQNAAAPRLAWLCSCRCLRQVEPTAGPTRCDMGGCSQDQSRNQLCICYIEWSCRAREPASQSPLIL